MRKSRRSRCRTIRPVAMRETSSRSSISLTISFSCRSITSLRCRSRSDRRIDDGQQLDAGFDRRERIAQLVRERGEEFVLATIGLPQRLLGESQLFELIPNPILPAAAAQRSLDRADERTPGSRSIQNRDVGQPLKNPHDRRCLLDIPAEREYGQVRPRRLLRQCLEDLDRWADNERPVCQDQCADPASDQVGRGRRSLRDDAFNARGTEDLPRDIGVLSCGSEDDNGFAVCQAANHRTSI